MSEQVTYTWKLRKLNFTWTMEEKYLKCIVKEKWEIPEYHSTWKDYFYEELVRDTDDKYLEHNWEFYEVMEKNDIYWHDIYESNENKDGTISYQVSYYNWGCSFHEAVDMALENVKS